MSENEKKRKTLTVEIDDEIEAALEERMEYLRTKQRYRRVTKSDAVRHALLSTGYKRPGKNKSDDDD